MSLARPFVFSLLAGLFALVSSCVLTGQSLTSAPFRSVAVPTYPGNLAVSAPAQTPMATAAALQAPVPADDDTPWGFFTKNIKHADTVGKWLALIFFTTMLTYLYLPRLVLGVVIVVAGLALVQPRVRHSKLVRGGLVLVSIGWVALAVAGRFNDNPLGFGFLLAFTTPLGAAMMLLGAMQALFTRTDRRLNRDIAALVAAAEASSPLWPDEPPLPEIDRVATHGMRAGSALMGLLETKAADPSSAASRSVHVEQQAALALCKIFSVLPTAGETVRDARSTPQENEQVTAFWRRKVRATPT
jgi:hypothetical protein